MLKFKLVHRDLPRLFQKYETNVGSHTVVANNLCNQTTSSIYNLASVFERATNFNSKKMC